MSDNEETNEQRTPHTPRARQLEIMKENIALLERLGHSYAANRQRELLEKLEATQKDKQQ